MKADTFVKLLRKVTVKNSMVESIKPAKPTQPAKPTAFTSNNVLNEILNQTAQAGDWRSIADMNSSNAMGFGGMMTEPAVVDSVDAMLANTRPAGDINSVRIDTVPDFSGLMQTMKAKGQI